MASRVSTLETDSAALHQENSSLQGTHDEVSDQVAQLHLLLESRKLQSQAQH